MILPAVDGPVDLPDLRNWLLHAFRIGGSLDQLDGHYIRGTMRTAHLWWVEPETCELLAAAAPTIPDDVTLDITDIPSMSGFAVFAHPLVGTDAQTGTEMQVNAICWGPVHLPLLEDPTNFRDSPRVALGIGMFARYDLEDGLGPDDIRRAAPALAMLPDDLSADVVWQPDNKTADKYRAIPGDQVDIALDDFRRHGDVVSATISLHGPLYSYLGRTDWLHGATITDLVADAPRRNEDALRSMREDRRLLASLWAIVRTPIVTTVRTRPPRHVARRSERKQLSADVRVLRLGGERRTNLPTGNVAGRREWRHSWIVGAHHRWQACGPGWSQRKLILVLPYRKGPEDKPLLGGERVWRVVPPPTT